MPEGCLKSYMSRWSMVGTACGVPPGKARRNQRQHMNRGMSLRSWHVKEMGLSDAGYPTDIERVFQRYRIKVLKTDLTDAKIRAVSICGEGLRPSVVVNTVRNLVCVLRLPMNSVICSSTRKKGSLWLLPAGLGRLGISRNAPMHLRLCSSCRRKLLAGCCMRTHPGESSGVKQYLPLPWGL
jgi:hypothetical protein